MRRRLTPLLVLLLAGAASFAAARGEPAQSAVELRLALRGGLSAIPPADLLVLPPVESDAPESTFTLDVALSLPPLPAGSRVTCRGSTVWCPVVVVEQEIMPRNRDAARHLELPVFPKVRITGLLEGPVQLPTQGVVQGAVQAGASGFEESEATHVELHQVVTVEDGRFTLVAPDAPLDLRLSFPGAAPIYRWDLLAGKPGTDGVAAKSSPEDLIPVLDLGTLRLHPGGSLNGWVQRAEDELPVAAAVVQVQPLAGNDGDPLLEAVTSSDEPGFFQALGLAPGSYRLEVTAEGRVPQILEPVQVEAGAETQVGVVALSPPLTIRAQVHPPQHPSGAAWEVALFPTDRSPGEEPTTASVAEDGSASLTGLRPASYRVKVQSVTGETFVTETHTFRGDSTLILEVPLVEVRGSVRLGDEPLEAGVQLESGGGDRVDLESTGDGELQGWMRRPDRAWLMATVTWTRAGETLERTLDVVPVLGRDGIEVEIELPSGEVEGEVVDGLGRPQRDFPVTAKPAEAASSFTEIATRTDSRGRFRLDGLEPGAWHLQAGGGGRRTSEIVALTLEDGEIRGTVRLVVRDTREVRVRVTVDGQPLRGATVSLTSTGPAPVSLHGTTSVGGEETFRVPVSNDRAVVSVLAPSHLLWSGCAALGDGDVALDLPSGTGVLSLALVGRNDLPPVLGGRMVLLTGDGGFLPYGTLVEWNRLRADERRVEEEGTRVVEALRLPALAAGTYAATWTGSPDGLLAELTCGGSLPSGTDTPLPPGGEAELRLDLSKAQEDRLRELESRRPAAAGPAVSAVSEH